MVRSSARRSFIRYFPLEAEIFLGIVEGLLVLTARFSLAIAVRVIGLSVALTPFVESLHFVRVDLNEHVQSREETIESD